MKEKCRSILPPCIPCPVGIYSVLHLFDKTTFVPPAPAASAGSVPGARCGIEFQPAAAPVAAEFVVAQGPRFDIPGPMMKTVRDPSLSLIALSGLDPEGPVMAEVPLVMESDALKVRPALADWRIGFADEYLHDGVLEAVEHSNGFLLALEVLRASGADVVPVVAQLPDTPEQFSLASGNEIDKRVSEHRLDALVSDGQSPAFHLFCKTGYPGVCQIFSDGLQGTRVVLWFYGARWARDSLSVLVRVYQQAMQAHADMPVR